MTFWSEALWQQFGAALDALESAIQNCPDSLWTGRLWVSYSDPPAPDGFSEYWYLAYHTIFWVDLYLYGTEEGFKPPAPFNLTELEWDAVIPEAPYSKELLLSYLDGVRARVHETCLGMTEEQARHPHAFPWSRGKTVSYFELQIYSLRHTQEHAAELHLFLGQNMEYTANVWVARAKSQEN